MTTVAASDPSAPAPGGWTPSPYRIVERVVETPGLVTVTVTATDAPLARPEPGQFHMVWAFGVGEIPVSVSGIADDGHQHTIEAVGAASRAVVELGEGSVLGLRGPFGVGWPLDLGRPGDRAGPVLVVAGGIGFAPVRPVVEHSIRQGRPTTLVAGARAPDALLYAEDRERWAGLGVEVHATVDHATREWGGEVGLVTAPLPDVVHDPETMTAFVCGPEPMIGATAQRLVALGLAPEAIAVSLERNMHCGHGRCGRCQLGPVLLCLSGPVLPWSRAEHLLEVPGW